SVDHDCTLGRHVHLSPGTTLSGEVFVDDCAHIGTGASVIQQVKIGSGSTVAAGATVISDVPDGATVAGVPARVIRRREKLQ
ncbi:MAG: sugar acetyltransferase, partial [Chloroflexi bacterium]|nr:sugar acetyltransferase [Chloroflexota bacterium]